MAIRNERIEFPGAAGEMLAARLDRPMAPPVATALFAHCFTCSKEAFAASRISLALAERGIAVLRFDFTGLGSSQGDFANTNFSSNVADLVAAAEFMGSGIGAPSLLIGHSLGGAAVLAAAGSITAATAVVTINAPAGPEHVRALLTGSLDEIESAGEAEVTLGGRKFKIRRQFLEDLEGHGMAERIKGLRKALLVLHTPQDQVVGVENARLIFEAARHPKSFAALEGADHLLSRREDARYAGDLIAAWVMRYLPGYDSPPAALPRAAAGEVVVAETGEGRYTQAIAAGGLMLRADEPESFGGNGSGPSPYDLLMAALGACTSMTLRMYAERKKWPLEKVTVRLNHGKIHAEDCAACETEKGMIDRFQRTIAIEGELSAEQIERLLQIADKCPVHRTLHAENLVETLLEE